MWGSLICGLSVFPAFWLMENAAGNTLMVWLAIVIPFGIFYAMVYGPEAALFAELFDAKVRYTGISFVYQFSGIFASGLTPIIATALFRMNGGKPWAACGYVLFSALVSAWSARAIERQRRAEVYGDVMKAH
jgi:MHS family metabolite:H+ symporter-like MFS transporter